MSPLHRNRAVCVVLHSRSLVYSIACINWYWLFLVNVMIRSTWPYLQNSWQTQSHRSQINTHFHTMLRHCWLGDRKGIWPVKSWVLVCWWWWSDCSFAHLTAVAVTTSSIILSSNKIQNGDILVPANAGRPRKRPLNDCRVVLQISNKHVFVWFSAVSQLPSVRHQPDCTDSISISLPILSNNERRRVWLLSHHHCGLGRTAWENSWSKYC